MMAIEYIHRIRKLQVLTSQFFFFVALVIVQGGNTFAEILICIGRYKIICWIQYWPLL